MGVISIFCIIVGIFCLLLNNKKLNTFGTIIILTGIALIASIRPHTVPDTENYKTYFEYSKTITHYAFSFGRTYFPWIEDWYLNFCSVFSKNGVPFEVFLFIMAFMNNGIAVYSINRIVNIYVPGRTNNIALLLLYISNYGFLYSYVVIRGGLSFAFCLFGVSLFLDKKYLQAALVVFVAIALHNYSLIILLVLFLLKKGPQRLSPQFCLFCFISFLVAALIRLDVLFTNYVASNFLGFLSKFSGFSFSHYIQNTSGADGIKKGTVLILLQSIYLTYLFWNQIKEKAQLSRFMFVLIIGGAISVLINNNATARMSNFFSIYQIVLFMEYLTERSSLSDRSEMNRFVMERSLFLNGTLICLVFPLLNLIYILRYCMII